MKTGRRRKKETTPAKKITPSRPSPKTPARSPTSQRASRPSSARNIIIPAVFAAFVVLIVGIVICTTCLGPKPETYLPAEAKGSWTATIKVLEPNLVAGEGWRSDCEANADCMIVPGTCQTRERKDEAVEHQIDEYDDYAYNIYYEELERQLYEAAGQEFVVTQLNADRDWIEQDRHYYASEWLDEETCQYTQYTAWIDDPGDPEYEIEVVLSECEVWDHVIVKERVYGEDDYCQTQTVGSLVVKDTLTQRGTGTTVRWPSAVAPMGGDLERQFEGVVVFRAEGGVMHTLTVDDENKYIRYLTVQQYLGLDKRGKVIRVTSNAP